MHQTITESFMLFILHRILLCEEYSLCILHILQKARQQCYYISSESFFFSIFIYSSVLQYIPTMTSPSSPLPIHPTSEYIIVMGNKTRHNPSNKGLLDKKKQQEEKGVTIRQKNQRQLYSYCQGSNKNPKLNKDSLHAEGLVQTNGGDLAASLVSMSPYECCLVDSVDYELVSSTFVVPTILPPYLLLGFLIFGFGFLHLFPSSAGGCFTDEDWARYLAINHEYSRILLAIIPLVFVSHLLLFQVSEASNFQILVMQAV